MCISFVVILYIHRNRKVRHQSEKEMLNQQHQQELLSTQLEMQSQTMQQIGREIHDNVGQQLTLASLYIQQLVYENKAPQVKDRVEHVGNIINQSLNELRKLSKSLTDDHISDHPVTDLLQKECDKINALGKCRVSFQSAAFIPPLTYQVKSIILRVVQEFFQNSIKHSGCTGIRLVLSTAFSQLDLHAEDDGSGFDTGSAPGKGIGLLNMRKRTEMIGGSFFMESSSSGTKLHISLPLSTNGHQ